MENLRERLIMVIEKLGLTKAKFEKTCGLSNGFVDKSGDNTRRASLDKISKKYPNININWLITGEGEMLHENPQSVNINGNGVQINGINSNSPIVNRQCYSDTLDALHAQIELLESRIGMLEKLLAEKERTIQILLKK